MPLDTIQNHVGKVDTTIAYDESEIGQVVIFLINQAIKMKSLNHHLLCPMQCSMNGVWIDDVLNLLAPVSSENMHEIQIMIPFNAPYQIIIP